MKALETLLRDVGERLFRYIRSLVRDDELAADVHQDVLIIISKKLRWLEKPACFSSWCYRIAGREAARASMKEARSKSIIDAEFEVESLAAESPTVDLTENEKNALLGRVQRLPVKTRQLFVLHYYHGWSLSETAGILGIPIGTTKSRLNYGLRLLRDSLQTGSTIETDVR